jgi:hypothetical protein
MITKQNQMQDVLYCLRRGFDGGNELIIDKESSRDSDLLAGSSDRDSSSVSHSEGEKATMRFITLRTKEAPAQLHSHRHHSGRTRAERQ